MLDRRAFLRRLGFGTVSAAAAACAFDVDKLLWLPGERFIIEIARPVVIPRLLTFQSAMTLPTPQSWPYQLVPHGA